MRLTFEEWKHEDRATIEYEILKLEMVRNNEKPIEVIRFRDRAKATYVVVKMSEFGRQITTTTIQLNLAESPFFDSHFVADFPDVGLSVYDGSEV